MIAEDSNYMSKEKFDELTAELDHLKTVRRREIAEQLEYARSLGDLSENAEYEEARNLQAATEDRIRSIEETLSRARIIEHIPTRSSGAPKPTCRSARSHTFLRWVRH
jgi:transcription elongation factor GreA